MTETTIQETPETNLFDEQTHKAIMGLVNNPFAQMMLKSAKQKAAGVKVENVFSDAAGVHFTLNDTVSQKSRRVIITMADLEKYIRLLME